MSNSTKHGTVKIAQSQTAFIESLQAKHRCSFREAVFKALELAQLAHYTNTATAANSPIETGPAPLIA